MGFLGRSGLMVGWMHVGKVDNGMVGGFLPVGWDVYGRRVIQ